MNDVTVREDVELNDTDLITEPVSVELARLFNWWRRRLGCFFFLVFLGFFDALDGAAHDDSVVPFVSLLAEDLLLRAPLAEEF